MEHSCRSLVLFTMSSTGMLRLASGTQIPQLGFGSTPESYKTITMALEAGIRHGESALRPGVYK
jgi:hypothetical protein